jgi:histidyl-tRNA synthetase
LAEKSEAPIGLIVGEQELQSNTVRIKQLGLGVENKGDLVERPNMVSSVLEMLKSFGE